MTGYFGSRIFLTTLLLSAIFVTHISGMENVGTINGKLFIADLEEHVQAATAQTRCHFYNATVALIESEEENYFIVEYMVARNATSFWLDVTDYPNEGSWRYGSSGERVTYSRFSVWTSNSAWTNCAYIWVGPDSEGYRGLWYPAACSSPNGDGERGKQILCTKPASS